MVGATLNELEELLTEERDAIQRLDGQRVLELAAQKQALMASLHELHVTRNGFAPADARRFSALVPQLRQNGVLLVHARNVLRDAVAVLGGASAATALPLPSAPRATLSVRG